MFSQNLIFNIGTFTVSCLLVAGYYLYLNWRARHEPGYTVPMVNARVRAQWVETVMSSGKMEILAIQTLRNSMMAANFMASTAVLLMLGALNLSQNIAELAAPWQSHALIRNEQGELWTLQLGILLIDFFIAFYCFSMAIRFFNHVGYMISLPGDKMTDEFSCQQVTAYLNRAGYYYSFGTRALFFSFPIMIWFFGPYFLITATLGLIIALFFLDRAP
ncbi:MAG: DUF599 domain-containing protein [Methylococcaceae bacterium]|nr:DUF599 domain-containing protein [Methylococcaceae bacterium]